MSVLITAALVKSLASSNVQFLCVSVASNTAAAGIAWLPRHEPQFICAFVCEQCIDWILDAFPWQSPGMS